MEKYLKLIRKGLVGAVNDRFGTGKEARLKDITVAGKTGQRDVPITPEIYELLLRLQPDGYLFIGHSESLFKVTDRFK